ncbi:MAG: type II toxin-antitoxin system MqsA family antitoxin [Smithella sp.]|jgi:YgiT-type zinc finger domain-containing protein
MKCVICKKAETVMGTATVTLERGEFTYIVKGVPAQVCPNCGEDYVSEQITSELLKAAEQMVKSGTLVDIRHYLAA